MTITSSEHYCFIFSNNYQNNDKIGSGFLPTSGKIPPTSGSSDWPNGDRHIALRDPVASRDDILRAGLRVFGGAIRTHLMLTLRLKVDLQRPYQSAIEKKAAWPARSSGLGKSHLWTPGLWAVVLCLH